MGKKVSNRGMKKIVYIANARIPTEKAHGIQVMKMCEAFARKGTEIELVIPWRFNHIKEDPFDYYDVEKLFNIKKIPSLDLVKFGKIGFLTQSISFSITALVYALFARSDAIYSRDALPLFFLSFFKDNLFWEVHVNTYSVPVRRIIQKVSGIIAITKALKGFYADKGVSENKIIVAPDAVEIQKFDISKSSEESRDILGLPHDKYIIVYTGHLYEWKGVNTLARARKYLREDEIIVFVGGTETNILDFRKKYGKDKNIFIVGNKSHSEIPLYLKAGDVLVLPNSAHSNVSKLYTSPLKLFEYMASKRPIVASNVPSIREILSDGSSVFFTSDDPEDLALKIHTIRDDPALAERIAGKAFEDVKKYSWNNRALTILKYLKR